MNNNDLDEIAKKVESLNSKYAHVYNNIIFKNPMLKIIFLSVALEIPIKHFNLNISLGEVFLAITFFATITLIIEKIFKQKLTNILFGILIFIWFIAIIIFFHSDIESLAKLERAKSFIYSHVYAVSILILVINFNNIRMDTFLFWNLLLAASAWPFTLLVQYNYIHLAKEPALYGPIVFTLANSIFLINWVINNQKGEN